MPVSTYGGTTAAVTWAFMRHNQRILTGIPIDLLVSQIVHVLSQSISHLKVISRKHIGHNAADG